VARVVAVVVRDLPVLVVGDQEPRQVLAQLRQAVAHQLQADDDVVHLARAGQLPAVGHQVVQRADDLGGLDGDLARRHRAGQLGHRPASGFRPAPGFHRRPALSAAGLHATITCSGICLQGGTGRSA
jgi:hypothetical protein